MERNKMMIILTTGPDDRGNRATLAYTMGVTALISGVDVEIFLTMGGTFWSRATPVKSVHIQGFDPLWEYVEQFRELGGRILVCSPCNDFYCAAAGAESMLEGAEIAGLTHVVDSALDASVVTF